MLEKTVPQILVPCSGNFVYVVSCPPDTKAQDIHVIKTYVQKHWNSHNQPLRVSNKGE